MHKLLVVVVTCCVVVFAKLPAYIHKCSIKDPNINACALKSAREAVPHLVKGDRSIKMPVMDPLFVSELRVAEKGLDVSALNFTVTGLKDIVLDKLSFDADKKEIAFEGTQPYLNFSGSYKISGKLASLPISGNGPYTFSFYNLTILYKATYDLRKMDDGQVYMIFTDYDCLIIPEHVQCRMENLFNGNKLLGEAMNTFLNENWRLVYKEFGKSLSLAVGEFLFNIIKESVKTVPFNEIFNDVE